MQIPGDQNTVCRNLISCLQEYLISYNHIVYINDYNDTIAVHLTLVFFGTVL